VDLSLIEDVANEKKIIRKEFSNKDSFSDTSNFSTAFQATFLSTNLICYLMINKIKQHKAWVGIIGLGRVGEQLARLAASRGFKVVGVDKSDERIKALRKIKNLEATTNPEKLKECSIFIICVQTPINKKNKPDYGFLINACQTISQYLKKGDLVVLESSVAPGTTKKLVAPLLEQSQLKTGKDFLLAYCPERLDLGNKRWELEQIPRVIGGINKESGLLAKAFYEEILVVPLTILSSPTSAEAAKLVENIFRDVNIAFVNELAKYFDRLGIDLSEVIRGASTKPFGYMPFFPGPGVGGDCIPVNPYYLIEKAKEAGFDPKLLKLAREINDSMPKYVVKRLEKGLKFIGESIKGAEIALLGIAYKANVGDPSHSPALEIIKQLKGGGAKLRIFDPLVPSYSNRKSVQEALDGAKGVMVVTPHKEFLKIPPKEFKSKGVKVFIDGRNAFDKEEFKRLGIIYLGIGKS
jgi:UDP-N-acetyl-D-glucosamine dehydrogenase